jgi:RHS repeat-associated protein
MYASYNFDDANRLTNIVNSADSSTISFGYDNADRLTSRNYPNGVSTTYEYDGMSRLKRLKDVSSTATLFDRQYRYNNASQIDQITEPALTRTIGYDFVNRLTSVTASNSQNESYNFDDVGNRTSSHRSASYGYQPFNKVITTATANYVYDANGNMVSKAEGSNFWRYGFDYENRLVSASTRKQTVRYRYDALGRRVQRYIVGGKENTKFIYDGQDVLVDDNSGTLTKYLNGAGIDNKLRSQTGSTVNYFLADHLGSTNGLTDSSGNLTASTNYDAFGNATNAEFPSRYQFTGREYDSFTGLHYYRARFYDANLGRFISEDPIGFAGGDVNLYGYVWNNPLKWTDPTGKFPIWDHGWYYYYSKKCAETGIECANALNGANQSQQDLERMAQDAFNRGAGSVSGLRFKAGYADNYYCRQMEEYAKYVYGDSFPTNVQRVDPNGSVTKTAENVAKTQPISKATRAWEWIKSWF